MSAENGSDSRAAIKAARGPAELAAVLVRVHGDGWVGVDRSDLSDIFTMSATEAKLFLLLKLLAGYSPADFGVVPYSQNELADMLSMGPAGLSRSTVQRAIQGLQKLGRVRIEGSQTRGSRPQIRVIMASAGEEKRPMGGPLEDGKWPTGGPVEEKRPMGGPLEDGKWPTGGPVGEKRPMGGPLEDGKWPMGGPVAPVTTKEINELEAYKKAAEEEEEREEYQQQHGSVAAAAEEGSAETLDVLKAVQAVFPSAKRGDKWESELAGIGPEQRRVVAGILRERPAKRVRNPVVLVREAVIEAKNTAPRARRGADRPADLKGTVEMAGRLAASGDRQSLEIVRQYAGEDADEAVRELAAGILREIEASQSNSVERRRMGDSEGRGCVSAHAR